MNHRNSAEMQQCIDNCQQCHIMCLQTVMNHCLETGGAHLGPQHMRLMLNCAELCQTCANFMLSSSPVSAVVCRACAEICNACADSCEQIGDMESCVESCRRCAASCAAMAKGI